MLPLKIVQPFRSQYHAKRSTEFRDRIDALLAQVGLKGFGNKFPWQLSGGMQQRASICRALIHEPKLLMLDEPFGALDAFTREELWCVLRDLWQAQRFTVRARHPRSARGGVPRRHRVLHVEARPGASSRSARSTSRARATSRSPTKTGSPRSCTSCASTSGASARPEGEISNGDQEAQRSTAGRPGCSSARCSSPGSCCVRVFRIDEFVLPSASASFMALYNNFGPIMYNTWPTFWTTMVGFGARHRGGRGPRGASSGRRASCTTALYPLLVAFNAIPKAAFVPILVVWFGIGVVPATLTAFLICFFPITVNIATGLATIEPELEDVLRALGACAPRCCSRSGCRARCRSSSPRSRSRSRSPSSARSFRRRWPPTRASAPDDDRVGEFRCAAGVRGAAANLDLGVALYAVSALIEQKSPAGPIARPNSQSGDPPRTEQEVPMVLQRLIAACPVARPLNSACKCAGAHEDQVLAGLEDPGPARLVLHGARQGLFPRGRPRRSGGPRRRFGRDGHPHHLGRL